MEVKVYVRGHVSQPTGHQKQQKGTEWALLCHHHPRPQEEAALFPVTSEWKQAHASHLLCS